MGIIEELTRYAIEITKHIDEEVEKGYNLSKWGDLMKFLHALQIQAQILINLIQTICSKIGKPSSTYIHSGEILYREGILTLEEFKFYKSIVGFRNVIVHMYTRVNIDVVDSILRNREYLKILKLIEKLYRIAKDRGIDC